MAIPPVCVILAGGKGTRLSALAWHRAKPAVPFCGIFRLIDFTLSNSANSGLMRVGILTQYLPLSLMDHINDGSPWDMSARNREMRILPPQEGANAKDWYQGTAHAIYQNLDFILRGNEKEVMILSGDHIYHMDYRQMIEFHREKNADFTIATIPVSPTDAKRFGIAVTDNENRIIDFQEKPDHPKSLLGSMGIYIIERNILISQLEKIICQGKTDIGGDLVPSMLQSHKIFAFPFDGYWRDVGTLESYWQSSMDALDAKLSGLALTQWNLRTNIFSPEMIGRPPVQFGVKANVNKSLISSGCLIEGAVYRSILSPGVHVEKDAVVEDSILFHDVTVGKHSRIHKVIADKNAIIGSNVMMGLEGCDIPNQTYPDHLNTGITLLGKNIDIPDDFSIQSNCLIINNVKLDNYPSKRIAAGETVDNRTQRHR
ncbi:glucose-1-phosphate adenylyltransferase [bacterium]|nr:glucose-1-phosphate adenylyltransferase [candidate division CSSED10-310 bacterium]